MAVSLRVFSPILVGKKFIMMMDHKKGGWQRSIREKGGFWQGSFTLTGDEAFLQTVFYEWLGNHVEESVGGTVSWEGLIYEIEFTSGRVTRRRSLDYISNAIKVSYIDVGNSTMTETGYAVQNQSVGRYGRKDALFTLDDVTPAMAEAKRGTMLAKYAWPWARTVGGLKQSAKEQILVRVCGYVFTANWRFLTVKDGNTGVLSDWVGDIINTDCEFLVVGKVQSNGVTVNRTVQVPQRAWDTLSELVDIGDSVGNLWTLRVERGRSVVYEKMSTTPRYFMRGGELFTSNAARQSVDPYLIRPGVVRDMDYFLKRAEPGSFLEDARDLWVSEVSVNGDGQFQLAFDDPEV